MKVTRIDQKGIDLITQFEGLKLAPYICPAGVTTIGYGTTRYYNGVKVSMSDLPITKEKAIEYFMHDVFQFELAVDAMAVDSITQNQFNALVSFAYNLGPNALKNSTLLKKANKNPTGITLKYTELSTVVPLYFRKTGKQVATKQSPATVQYQYGIGYDTIQTDLIVY